MNRLHTVVIDIGFGLNEDASRHYLAPEFVIASSSPQPLEPGLPLRRQ